MTAAALRPLRSVLSERPDTRETRDEDGGLVGVRQVMVSELECGHRVEVTTTVPAKQRRCPECPARLVGELDGLRDGDGVDLLPVHRIRHVNSGAEMLGQVVDDDGPWLHVSCWYPSDGRRFELRFRKADGVQVLPKRYGGGTGGWRLDLQSRLAVVAAPVRDEEDAVNAAGGEA